MPDCRVVVGGGQSCLDIRPLLLYLGSGFIVSVCRGRVHEGSSKAYYELFHSEFWWMMM